MLPITGIRLGATMHRAASGAHYLCLADRIEQVAGRDFSKGAAPVGMLEGRISRHFVTDSACQCFTKAARRPLVHTNIPRF